MVVVMTMVLMAVRMRMCLLMLRLVSMLMRCLHQMYVYFGGGLLIALYGFCAELKLMGDAEFAKLLY